MWDTAVVAAHMPELGDGRRRSDGQFSRGSIEVRVFPFTPLQPFPYRDMHYPFLGCNR